MSMLESTPLSDHDGLLSEDEYLRRNMEVTAFPLEDVIADFGIDVRRLTGKRVLDLASGGSELVAHLRAHGVEAYGLDSSYGDVTTMRQEIEEFVTGRGAADNATSDAFLRDLADNPWHYTAASALRLPFRAGTFDAAYSHSFLTSYAGFHPGFVTGCIDEVLRVLKRGSEFTFGVEVAEHDIGELKEMRTQIRDNIRAAFEASQRRKIARKLSVLNLYDNSKVFRITKR